MEWVAPTHAPAAARVDTRKSPPRSFAPPKSPLAACLHASHPCKVPQCPETLDQPQDAQQSTADYTANFPEVTRGLDTNAAAAKRWRHIVLFSFAVFYLFVYMGKFKDAGDRLYGLLNMIAKP